jgi:hypothetical protein
MYIRMPASVYRRLYSCTAVPGRCVQAWFFDEYTKYGGHAPGVVTGKPINMHGSYGRAAATGRGTTFGIENMLAAYGDGPVKGKKFVIQARPHLRTVCMVVWVAVGAERCSGCLAGGWSVNT